MKDQDEDLQLLHFLSIQVGFKDRIFYVGEVKFGSRLEVLLILGELLSRLAGHNGHGLNAEFVWRMMTHGRFSRRL